MAGESRGSFAAPAESRRNRTKPHPPVPSRCGISPWFFALPVTSPPCREAGWRTFVGPGPSAPLDETLNLIAKVWPLHESLAGGQLWGHGEAAAAQNTAGRSCCGDRPGSVLPSANPTEVRVVRRDTRCGQWHRTTAGKEDGGVPRRCVRTHAPQYWSHRTGRSISSLTMTGDMRRG